MRMVIGFSPAPSIVSMSKMVDTDSMESFTAPLTLRDHLRPV